MTMSIKIAHLERMVPETGGTIRWWDLYNDSTTTRRPNGKIDVSVANPHLREEDFLSRYRIWTNRPGTYTQPNAAGISRSSRFPPNFDLNGLDNIVNAKFNGKLRKGSASLGVTLGSWKQSREMIVKRSRDIDRVMGHHSKPGLTPAQVKLLRRRDREPLANEVLEVEFGWRPFFEDVWNVIDIMTHDIPHQWVKARHRAITELVRTDASTYTTSRDRWIVNQLTTYGARVSVTNENLWLLNRLGLINPGVVIWDLVPWSFVVNMFVNCNQMISSITDEVGLTIDMRHVTRSAKSSYAQSFQNRIYGSGQELGFDAEYLFKTKKRVLGVSPTLRWNVRVPNVSWETAVIAFSLATQKVTKLNNKILGL